MLRRIATDRWPEIWITCPDKPYNWPLGTYSPLCTWRVQVKKLTLFVYTRLGSESLCKLIPKHLNERTILLAYDPKIIVWICSGVFWIFDEMLSYGRITFHFRIRVFTHTRWLFSYYSVFCPDARGYMWFYSVC